MKIIIEFFPYVVDPVPDHIRITKSLAGETGTVTFTFRQINPLLNKLKKIEEIYQISVKTDVQIYTTKDIRILWSMGRPTILQAVFVINDKNLFEDFLRSLQLYAFEKHLGFFQN